MTQPHTQPNPNELLSITREELERCCSQMSAAGYKVSANYVEAMVLSRSRPAPSHSECYKKGYADAVANALSQHADCVKCLEEDRVTMLEHDATIRKAERERYDTAIKEAIGHFQALDISSCDYIPPNEIAEYLKAMLESLRGGA